MVFNNNNNNNIFDSASKQDSSSQASFNGGEAQNMEAPVYTQVFDVDNKEADLYLTPNPYGFDLFESHLVSNSAPTPAQAANQPANQNRNPDLEQIAPGLLQSLGKFFTMFLAGKSVQFLGPMQADVDIKPAYQIVQFVWLMLPQEGLLDTSQCLAASQPAAGKIKVKNMKSRCKLIQFNIKVRYRNIY
ncbi:hypothetical protein DSO57_1027482 [Entomophthora muscae]|uniref:Uncharacterized protein n=1 Tax=Entomophthora muscae TaxID=34485 RepID=A0ACC2U178_9FUNG|nr:hypothetical protein DSO57_1027482 [Entomophthora muscae]